MSAPVSLVSPDGHQSVPMNARNSVSAWLGPIASVWPIVKRRYSDLYNQAYNNICGVHPNLKPWHFQWLWTRVLYKDLKRHLPDMRGRILDVGCGSKPYRDWFNKNVELVGIDMFVSPGADYVINPTEPWPLDSVSFDGVLCTQVLEHAVDLDLTLREIDRVLKPGGKLVLSAPFVYQEHYSNSEQRHDYRRFTVEGLRSLLNERYELLEAKREGGIGTILGGLWLNWLQDQLSALRAPLLPLWLGMSGLTNLLCSTLNSIDSSGAFYSNVFIVGIRRSTERGTGQYDDLINT